MINLLESYKPLFYEKPETKLSFECDYKGVKNADIFIFVADDTPRKYNGANVELGIALSDKKPCFSIGVLENSVLYYPIVKCANIQEVISRISLSSQKTLRSADKVKK